MKRVLILCAIFLSLTVTGRAQNLTNRFFIAYDKEAITVSSTAVPFTASKVTEAAPNSAALAQFSVNCASGTSCVLRYTTSGTATTSTGQRALYGDTLSIYGHDNILAFSSIRETSTDVVINITYYR